MRVVLLTTETTHHTYYAWKLCPEVPLAGIVLETGALAPPFDTFHQFEVERDAYEREVLLAGFGGTLTDLAPTHEVESANDAVGHLRMLEPDVVLVFGTARLHPPVIQAAAEACLNLHGGDPERYRGLDTHLWAIYHRDFRGLVTTLHHVEEELDCGDVAGQAPVPLERGMGIHQLRSRNTEVCIELSLEALRALDRSGSLPRRPQRGRGRYYSFMPGVLKNRVVAEFERHVASL